MANPALKSLSGKVLTVTGPLDPEELGRTLTHEHLSMNYSYFYQETENTVKANEPITLTNLGWVRHNEYSSKFNLRLCDDNEAVVNDLKSFKKHGGSSLVECTTLGITRDVRKLKQYSEATGVNVVSGTGFYLAGDYSSQRAEFDIIHRLQSQSEEEICKMLMNDILEGADGSDIRCGVIGEVASSYPIPDVEKKVLRATAAAQNELGCPVILHPEDYPDAPYEIMRVFQEAGGDSKNTVMSHLDYCFFKPEEFVEFSKLGTFMELDFFGCETSYWQFNDIDFLTDAQRIQLVKALVEEGYEDRIVIAHDIHTRHRLVEYGGHGYAHILVNVLPKMLKRGISQEVIDKITVTNPRRWLTFK
ncbi:N-acetyltaurine hydrolase-like [Saccoglossus kowalevskii]|uniref:Phosphotriesterase-related protein-like n=1 Tax=Saccoglossus kowalevskii TaxID=10224 RepID=A0ABM0GQW4_SACKO|nr:PREDICTED: phosphotriesterase-related protein-like [Saccoglossus kowalevskii]